ncbi:MAG TPA: hypothetical protein PLK13_21480 [Xanthobacteraceae bacterium]|jgi:hypothetical protein|nr:hypothetical protein [Xanthobacteraceae bacterium]
MTVSVVERVARLHQLDLRDELLCARVLDFGLVEPGRRVEDLFLDRRMDGQHLADLARQGLPPDQRSHG